MRKLEIVLERYKSKKMVNEYSVDIEVENFPEESIDVFLRENLPDLHEEAAKRTAASMFHIDAFNSESDYMDAVARVAESLYLKDIRIPKVEYRSYVVEYHVHDEDDPIIAEVEASSVEEADFRARWKLIEAEPFGYSAQAHAELGCDSFVGPSELDAEMEIYELIRVVETTEPLPTMS